MAVCVQLRPPLCNQKKGKGRALRLVQAQGPGLGEIPPKLLSQTPLHGPSWLLAVISSFCPALFV